MQIEPVTRLIAAAVLVSALAAGCATRSPQAGLRGQRLVPQGAQLVADGVPPITYLLSLPGTLYVVDSTQNTLIHSGYYDMEPDYAMLLVVDPVDKAIVLRDMDGDEAYLLVRQIDPASRFAIWFVPEDPDRAQQRRR